MKKSLVIAVLGTALVFSGCGSLSENSAAYRSDEYAAEPAVAEEAYYEGSDEFSSGYSADYDTSSYAEDKAYDESEDYDETTDDAGSTAEADAGTDVVEYGSKIIRNASVSLEVSSLEEFSDNLKRTVKDYGGYMESMDINSYDSEYSESRYGYFTARIPSEKLDDFLNIVNDEGIITSKSESAEDVTLKYVDTQAKIATYEAERDSLLELLKEATSLKDILTIREEIAKINYELESLQRQLKSMQNKVSYSTVQIDAEETRTVNLGGGGEKSLGQKLWEDFTEQLADGLEIAFHVAVFIITRLPLFAILGLFAYLVVWIIRKIIGSGKKSKTPKMSRQEKKAAKEQAKMQGRPVTGQGQTAQAGQSQAAAGQTTADGQTAAGGADIQMPAPPPITGKPAGNGQQGGHYTSNTPLSSKDEEKDDGENKEESGKNE
ncbi:MAG: DUF4349 domain-containing protein [Lachnospiraceae bacterium]|nr:DUF4349 domain-containing protein [Lachnospiraceae bacterium]